VARVVVAERARADLRRLISTHSLPGSTTDRVRASITPLATFPAMGTLLVGRWEGHRVILGPWRWMLIVYAFDAASDTVNVITIQDARSGAAARQP
jgi:plasmid stabilization system protein ParE